MKVDSASALARKRWRSFRGRRAPGYAIELERAVDNPATLLDVGCGFDSPIASFARRVPYSVGVEGYEPALLASRNAGTHDDYRLLDVRQLAGEFEPGSFDAVLAVDLLEHLSTEEGLALITTMETIARRRVVVFTPNGFVPQGDVGGTPLQAHRSGWTVGALRALGYSVIGVHGLRFLRSEEASIRWRPRRFWALVSDLTQPVARRLPSTAYHLLATKQLGASSQPTGGEKQALD